MAKVPCRSAARKRRALYHVREEREGYYLSHPSFDHSDLGPVETRAQVRELIRGLKRVALAPPNAPTPLQLRERDDVLAALERETKMPRQRTVGDARFRGAMRRVFQVFIDWVAVNEADALVTGETVRDAERRLRVEECLTCPNLGEPEAEVAKRYYELEGVRGWSALVAGERGITTGAVRRYKHDAFEKIKTWIEARAVTRQRRQA